MYNRLFKFAIVGGCGFIVDFAVFTLLSQLIGWDLMVSRSLAFICAATTTWIGNRMFTFSELEGVDLFQQWRRFFISACISVIPNFIVFKLSLEFIGTEGLLIYVALVLGTLVGMVSNFKLSTRWVFI